MNTLSPHDTTGSSAAVNQPADDRAYWDKDWKARAQRGFRALDAPSWENERDEMLLEFIRPWLPPSGTIAEVGCGTARTLARIARLGPYQLVAVDYSEEALHLVAQTAREFNIQIRTQLDDVNQLSIPDASFDFVMSGGLLEHFIDPRLPLSEMIRVLKPGGAFYANVVPRKVFSLHRPLHRILGPQVQRTKYGPAEYGRWLHELGCVDVTTLSKGFYPPLFHHLPTKLRRPIERGFRRFDGTWLSDHFGYIFVAAARKQGR